MASSKFAGAKCAAKAYGKPSLAASEAEYNEDPNIYIGTYVPMATGAFT